MWATVCSTFLSQCLLRPAATDYYSCQNRGWHTSETQEALPTNSPETGFIGKLSTGLQMGHTCPILLPLITRTLINIKRAKQTAAGSNISTNS